MLTDQIIQIGPDGTTTTVTQPGFSSDLQWYMYANWISDMVVVKLVILAVAVAVGVILGRIVLGHRPAMMASDPQQVTYSVGYDEPVQISARPWYAGPYWEQNRQARAITAERATVEAWASDLPQETRQPAPYRLKARDVKPVNGPGRRQIGGGS